MLLTSINVPQADDLNKIIAIVKCKYLNGYLSENILNLTNRQVDYYEHAARILGFFDRYSNLTRSGIMLATTSQPLPLLSQAFRNSTVYREWENWAHSSGTTMQGQAGQFLTDYFNTANLPRNLRLSDNQQGTGTISRRAKTLEDWYAQLN